MLKIDEESRVFIEKCEEELREVYKNIDDICNYNSYKVLKAFQDNNVSDSCFIGSTGYGYDDIGRTTIENIFKDIFEVEDALVRCQLVSGSHALSTTLFGILRPGDTMMSISGLPYDTLHEVIGIKENKSSLKSFNINYEQIDLINNDFDYKKIEEVIKTKKIKLIEIQRSKGYSTRKSLTVDKVNKVYDFIKSINKDIIIMIDNCYCEFVEIQTPTEVGADIMVGSLIKNLGGGIAPNGAYVAGRADLIDLVGERLTLPGEGLEVGPTLGINKSILQGLFMAPSVVASSLKTAILASYLLEKLGYGVEPKYNDVRADIVQNITLGSKEALVNFCTGIQQASPIDSNAVVEAWDMPGYTDQVVMASGSFTSGSSIELSCDGPCREPYIAYLQGGLTYEYGKLGIISAINKMGIN